MGIAQFLFTVLFLAAHLNCTGQSRCDEDLPFRILHFTKTTGFDHQTRDVSAIMFDEIGSEYGFTVTDTDDAHIFDHLDSLSQFAIVVFSNTSGNTLFDDVQRANFEAYVNGGGSFIGIHAATDTYRSGWPFYNTLVGAIVQSGPNHTNQNHVNFMDHQAIHPILEGIPDPWEKEEEYYYWDLNGGMIDTSSISELLNVRQTGEQSFDRERPITWYQTFPGGARSFYTALGHKRINFEFPENTFRQLIENAVCWAAYSGTTQVLTPDKDDISVYPNPTRSRLLISGINEPYQYSIIDISGNIVTHGDGHAQFIDVSGLPKGFYTIRIVGLNLQVQVIRFVKD